MAESQEIASTQEPTGMAAIKPTAELVQQAKQAIMAGELPPEVGDPQITQRLILQRIADGTFEESLEPTASLPSLQAYAGEPVVFHGFHLNPSAFRESDSSSPSAVYAVIEVSDPATGEQDVVQFGGVNVLMQLVKAWEEEKYPFRAVLTPQRTGQGYTTFWLRYPGSEGAEV